MKKFDFTAGSAFVVLVSIYNTLLVDPSMTILPTV